MIGVSGGEVWFSSVNSQMTVAPGRLFWRRSLSGGWYRAEPGCRVESATTHIPQTAVHACVELALFDTLFRSSPPGFCAHVIRYLTMGVCATAEAAV